MKAQNMTLRSIVAAFAVGLLIAQFSNVALAWSGCLKRPADRCKTWNYCDPGDYCERACTIDFNDGLGSCKSGGGSEDYCSEGIYWNFEVTYYLGTCDGTKCQFEEPQGFTYYLGVVSSASTPCVP